MSESDRGQRFGDLAPSTLALVGYLALASAIMVMDRRAGYLQHVRAAALSAAQPLYLLADLPARLGADLRFALLERERLYVEQATLKQELLTSRAELLALRQQVQELAAVQALIKHYPERPSATRVARLLAVDLDPYTHRVVLDRGRLDGVVEGSTLLDLGGVYGQVVEVGHSLATARLLSDPTHALPVEIPRSGARGILFGIGDVEVLELRQLPLSADVKIDDQVVTSGLGGRFARGLPVGQVIDVRRLAGDAFATARVRPAARLGQGRELLLLPPLPPIGPDREPRDEP